MFNNIFLNKTDVKMYQFIKYSETLSTDGLASPKKYDYQIKCQPGCCIFNSQLCLLIPPLYLPDLSPQSFPKNWNKPAFRLFCDLSLPYFSSNQIPHISSFSCCLWSELDSQPTISTLPLTIPKWRETYLPWGLSECLPKITLIPNSLLKYLKSQ